MQEAPKEEQKVSLITRFAGEHKKVCHIIQKYWHLLATDDVIAKYVNPYPQLTYRKSRSLKDQLVHSHLMPRQGGSSRRGTAPCGKCEICRFLFNSAELALPNGRIYKPHFFVNFQSIGVVYYLVCVCQAFYVGKTKRSFFHRIREHVSLVQNKRMETPISRHMGLYHSFQVSKMNFFALEHLPTHVRGGDLDRTLLQRETRWINSLAATVHPGLNESIS